MSPPANRTKKGKRPVEVVVFEDPDKPRKPPKTPKELDGPRKSKPISTLGMERPVFDQRAAMFDIRKLAMTGMQEEDKEEAMVNYLVELGAKRPKGKAIPMKEYVEKLKKRKLEGADKSTDGGNDSNRKKQKRKKRDKNDIFVDGQIGKWKRGVQFINSGKKLQKRI